MRWDHLTRGGGSDEYYWDEFQYASVDTSITLSQYDGVLLFKMRPGFVNGVLCNYVYFVVNISTTFTVPKDTYYLVTSGTGMSGDERPYLYFYDEDGTCVTVLEDSGVGGVSNTGTKALLALYPADAVVVDDDPYAEMLQ